MATEGKIQMWRRHLENRSLGRAQLYTLKILKYLWVDCLLTSVKKLIPQQATYLVSSCLTDFFFSAYMWIFAIVQKQAALINWNFLLKKYVFDALSRGISKILVKANSYPFFSSVPLFLCKCHWSRFCVVI